MDIYALLGRRVREERTKAGFTIEELAGVSSISSSFLAYIEQGRKKASLVTIKKLADGLRIPIGRLFSDMSVGVPDENKRTIQRLIPLLKEKKPKDQDLIIDVLKTLAKGLPKR